jgi:type II secretory pathway component PulF
LLAGGVEPAAAWRTAFGLRSQEARTLAYAMDHGTLPAALAQLDARWARRAATRRELAALLWYPSLVLIATLIIGSLMVGWVLPAFADVLPALTGSELPALTRALLIIGQPHIVAGLLGFVTCSTLAIITCNRVAACRAIIYPMCLRLPRLGTLIRLHLAADWLEHLEWGLAAGDTLSSATAQANAALDPAWHPLVAAVPAHILAGHTLSSALGAIRPWPAHLIAWIECGELDGSLSSCLVEAAQSARDESRQLLSELMRWLEPALLACLALLTGLLVLAIILPLAGAMQAMGA